MKLHLVPITLLTSTVLTGCFLESDSKPNTHFQATALLKYECGITEPNTDAYFIIHNDDFSTKEYVYADSHGVTSYDSDLETETISLVQALRESPDHTSKLKITTFAEIAPINLGEIQLETNSFGNCECYSQDISIQIPEDNELQRDFYIEEDNISSTFQFSGAYVHWSHNTSIDVTSNEAVIRNLTYCPDDSEKPILVSTMLEFNSGRFPYVGISTDNLNTPISLSYEPTLTKVYHEPYNSNDSDDFFIQSQNTKSHYSKFSTFAFEQWVSLPRSVHYFPYFVENPYSRKVLLLEQSEKYRLTSYSEISVTDNNNYSTVGTIKNVQFLNEISEYPSSTTDIYPNVNISDTFKNIDSLDTQTTQEFDVYSAQIDIKDNDFSWRFVMPVKTSQINLANLELSPNSVVDSRIYKDGVDQINYSAQLLDFESLSDFEDYMEVKSQPARTFTNSYNELSVKGDFINSTVFTQPTLSHTDLWRLSLGDVN